MAATFTFNPKDILPLLGGDAPKPDPPAQPPIPFIAPPPPIPLPTPAQAGFGPWVSDPIIQKKIADGITPPGQPLLPPPPANPQFSGVAPLGGTPPAPASPFAKVAPMPSASPQPPANPMANVQPMTPPPDPNAAKLQADQTELQRLQKTGSGVSQIKNPWLRTIARIGDAAGTILAPGVMSAVPGTTVHNWTLQNQKQGQVAGDQNNLKNVATLANTQSQTAKNNADTTLMNQKSDDMTPFTMTSEQAKAINKPELAGTQTTQKYYSAMLTGAGHDTSRNYATDSRAATQQAIAAMKPVQRDDRYIQIMSKPREQRTPDDLAFKTGYEGMINTKTTQPGIARMVAGANARPLQTVDDTTGDVVYKRAGDAIASGAAAPSSADYKATTALQKSFTSGDAAKNLTSFNTASAHLQTLSQAAIALHNGDTQAINRIGNEFARQTGSPAPTNFQAIKSAVAGEVSKTFKGGQATDAEIKEFNDAIGSANSPAQLTGVISTYQDLMDSKRQALYDQYQQGQQGKPNFGTPNKGSGGLSVTDPTGGVHTFKDAAAAAAFKKAAGIK